MARIDSNKLAKFFAIGVLVVAFLYSVRKSRYWESYFPSPEPPPLTLDEMVLKLRFNLSAVRPSLFEYPSLVSNRSELESIPVLSSLNELEKQSSRKPYIINSAELMKRDNEAEIDWWNVSRKWKVLESVLSLNSDESYDPNVPIDSHNLNNEVSVSVFVTPRNDVTGGSQLEDIGGGEGGAEELETPVVHDQMLFAEFLLETLNISAKHYYATNYQVLESVAELSGVLNWQSLITTPEALREETKSEEQESSKEGVQVPPQFWMLSKDSALQCRYSTYLTRRLQLRGTSRYFLFSPDKTAALKPFPSVHMLAKQSQLSLYDSIGPAKTSRGSSESAVQPSHVVDLSPGQVLHIPPLWMVHSEAGPALAVGLDVLSVPTEWMELSAVTYMSLPIRNVSLDIVEHRVMAAQIYLVHLISRIKETFSPYAVAQRIYLERFSRLYPRNGLFLARNKLSTGFHCYNEKEELFHHILNSIDKAFLIDGVEWAAAKVNQKMISKFARENWLGDYIEQVGNWAMGNADGVVLFLLECLTQRENIDVVVEVEGPPVMRLEVKDEL